jgi:hypothetical protein
MSRANEHEPREPAIAPGVTSPGILTVEGFLTSLASGERSQGRLSVGVLSAATCAAQLEAQCREVLVYRRQAPGPDAVGPLIAELIETRARLAPLIARAITMETAYAQLAGLPDPGPRERLSRQIEHEVLLSDYVVVGVEVSSIILSIARLARRVRKLRAEVRGGRPSEEVLLGAASVAIRDVVQRALCMSRSRDSKLRTAGIRALSKLRALCAVPAFGSFDADEHAESRVVIDDVARWN